MNTFNSNIYESAVAKVDVKRLPLVIQTVKNVNPTIEQMSAHIHLVEQILEDTTGSLTVISDIQALQWARIKSIVYLGKEMNRVDRVNKDRIKLHIIVSKIKILRIAIPIFNLFARLDASHVVFRTMNEAIDHASLENGIPFYE